MDCTELAKRARNAANCMQITKEHQRNECLRILKRKLSEKSALEAVHNANLEDLKNIEKGPLKSRLDLFPNNENNRYNQLVESIDTVIKLDSPTGKVSLKRKLDEDLLLVRESFPIGVLLIIFEARPEVIIQISSLAIKSGNTAILKGGKEANNTNKALFKIVNETLNEVHELYSKKNENEENDFPIDAIQLVESREEISQLLNLDKYIDLVIPRGSNSLVKYIQNNTRIPVMGHADGICSAFLRKDLDLYKSIKILIDAKTSYPAACNTIENLVVERDLFNTIYDSKEDDNENNEERNNKKIKLDNQNKLSKFVIIINELLKSKIELYLDEESYKVYSEANTNEYKSAIKDKKIHKITKTEHADAFDLEYLDKILSIKTVKNTNEAIDFINEHSSHHTDTILTKSKKDAELFMNKIDSAGVYWNCSTRFADGFRYGFGAEIGVSTAKTHARGPVGLEGIVIYKYKLIGNGHCSTDYGEGKKQYIHKDI